jgi:hypothetical protein
MDYRLILRWADGFSAQSSLIPKKKNKKKLACRSDSGPLN